MIFKEMLDPENVMDDGTYIIFVKSNAMMFIRKLSSEILRFTTNFLTEFGIMLRHIT